MVRQETRESQHNDAEPRTRWGRDLLLAGSEDLTMSTNRFWKSALPICGVLAEVAPGGEQIIDPAPQLEDVSSRAVASSKIARRNKCVLWMRILM